MSGLSTFTALIASIGAALPIIVSRIVDILKDRPTLQAIGLSGLTLAIIGVGTWGFNWARRSQVIRAVGDVVLAMRTEAFDAAAEHDLSFYDQFSSGRIVSRITSDTNDFGQLVVIVTDVASQLDNRHYPGRGHVPNRVAYGADHVCLRTFHVLADNGIS